MCTFMDQVSDSNQFSRIPAESVALLVESIGLSNQENITTTLVEDASYRVRQIVNVACHFAHHAKRRKLLAVDVDRALKWSNVESVYGHSCPATSTSFQYVHETGLFSTMDSEIRLSDIACDSPLNLDDVLSKPMTTSSQWLTLEGTSLVNDRGESTLCSIVELTTIPTEAQQKYLSLLLDAITGEKEEVRQVALHDLHTSAAVANILPYLCQFMQETMIGWMQYSPVQLVRFFRMVIDVFGNQILFLDPYAQSLLVLIQSIILHSDYLHCSATVTHWEVRELAACALAEVIRRCSTPLANYYTDLKASFAQQLSQSETSLAILYGVLLSLCHLGGQCVGEILLPRLTYLSVYIQRLLDTSQPSYQQNALKVYNVILIAAELLLVSEYGQSNHCQKLVSRLHSQQVPLLLNQDTTDTESQEGKISLYEFLVEIFGERLILKLEAHAKTFPKVDETRKLSVSHTSSLSNANLQALIDKSFRAHQRREGFISLHHLICSQRLVAMRKPVATKPVHCHPFCIKKYRLPLMHNPLQFKPTGYHLSSSQPVLKGQKCFGRKFSVFSNNSFYAVSSCWL